MTSRNSENAPGGSATSSLLFRELNASGKIADAAAGLVHHQRSGAAYPVHRIALHLLCGRCPRLHRGVS
jgi:hypothetical protein